jgi:DNA-binding NtrC family response regulator
MIRSFFHPGSAWGFSQFVWEVPLAERWSMRRLEDEYIKAVLQYTEGHRGHAAEILGIDRRTLYRRLREIAEHHDAEHHVGSPG